MVAVETRPPGVLRTVDEALEHVHAICFKTGPPRRVGVELEWTLQHADDPHRPLDVETLRAALGDHAPTTLDPASPHAPLPGGAEVTVEPGGQVEISTLPHCSLAHLHRTTAADLAHLADLMARQGLTLAPHGIDPHRPPRRLLHTPRYNAMAERFAQIGPFGQIMMCGTAATQVCLDAGEVGRVAHRWAALHALGPPLLALFANSSRHAGRDTGWASARMRAWLRTDPPRTRPVGPAPEPAAAWARYALAAPLLSVRPYAGAWRPPRGVTFIDWITGRISPPPTVSDLDYHLSTLFPPVRPRGYLEVRYLDAQPPSDWFTPVAVVAALLGDDGTIDAARGMAAPVAGAWTTAAREGLSDPALRAVATGLVDLACRSLDHTDLTVATRDEVAEMASRRLAGGQE